jgi:hypothetical protein
VIVTLSTSSVSKEGYVQRELRTILDIALEKPEGIIYILPLRLDDCERPRRLRPIQGVDYFPSERREIAYTKLLRSLELRATALGIPTGTGNIKSHFPKTEDSKSHPNPIVESQIAETKFKSAVSNPKKHELTRPSPYAPSFAPRKTSSESQGKIKIDIYPTTTATRPTVQLDGKEILRSLPLGTLGRSDRDLKPKEIFNELVNTGEHEIVIRTNEPKPVERSHKFVVNKRRIAIISLKYNFGWYIEAKEDQQSF